MRDSRSGAFSHHSLLLLFTIFSGILTGWLAAGLLEQLKQQPAFQSANDAGGDKPVDY
jgi:hypothetical protein